VSAEQDLRTDLLAHAPLVALITPGETKRVAADKVEAGIARPFLVFTRRETHRETTLMGELIYSAPVFELQCWADTRAGAEALADAAEAALAASTREPFGIPVQDRSSAYDGELDLECVVLVVEWSDEA
jgi:hypothetical protein